MAKKRVNKKSRAYRRRRRRRIIFGLELLVLLLVGCGLFAYAYINSKMNKMQSDELDFSNVGINPEVLQGEKEDEENGAKGTQLIALVGMDSRDNSLEAGNNSDTMIIACIDHDNKCIRLVSLYRDTWLNVFKKDENGEYLNRYTKCNAAYAVGGAEQMLTMMNKNLDLNITSYAAVNFKALSEAIDLLGGLDIDLTREELIHLNKYNKETSKVAGVDYEEVDVPDKSELDGAQKMTFHLNGTQSVSYARIRYTAGNDFRRAARQRLVIGKIMEKAKSADLSTLNDIMDAVFPMVKTSLKKQEIINLGMNLLSYDMGEQTGFPFDHLEGENVKNAMDGNDCVLAVTLETNVVKLHNFLFPQDTTYIPSAEVKEYSDYIINQSGYGVESIPSHSETGEIPQG